MELESDRIERGNARYSLRNAQHWISTKETGSHLLIDSAGKVVAGAGGALKDKTFSAVKSKSGDVEKKGEQKKELPERPKAKEPSKVKSLLKDTKTLATNPSKEESKKSIAKFFYDKPENIELVPVNGSDSLFRVKKIESGKIIEGCQVSVAKGRYRFEMGKKLENSSSRQVKVFYAPR